MVGRKNDQGFAGVLPGFKGGNDGADLGVDIGDETLIMPPDPVFHGICECGDIDARRALGMGFHHGITENRCVMCWRQGLGHVLADICQYFRWWVVGVMGTGKGGPQEEGLVARIGFQKLDTAVPDPGIDLMFQRHERDRRHAALDITRLGSSSPAYFFSPLALR